MPFDSDLANYVNIYNEFILLMAFGLIFLQNVLDLNEKTANIIGWILISLVLISWIIMWVNLLPSVIRELIKAIQKFLSKSENTENACENPTLVKSDENHVESLEKTQEKIAENKEKDIENTKLSIENTEKSEIPNKKAKKHRKKKKKCRRKSINKETHCKEINISDLILNNNFDN